MTERLFASLVPPSIRDERGVAFGIVMERALNDPDFKKLLFERIDSVDASALPFLIREFSIEEFVEIGMSDAVIRRLLKSSYAIHARKGFIDGVRLGLKMLGVRVKWTQWFEETPKREPGTHRAVLYVRQTMFDGQHALIDERVQRAVLRMIDGMKRWSQYVGFELAVEAASAFGARTFGQGAEFTTPTLVANPLPPDRLFESFGARAFGSGACSAAMLAQARPNPPDSFALKMGARAFGSGACSTTVFAQAWPNPPDHLACRHGAALRGVSINLAAVSAAMKPSPPHGYAVAGVVAVGAGAQVLKTHMPAYRAVDCDSLLSAALCCASLSLINARMEARPI